MEITSYSAKVSAPYGFYTSDRERREKRGVYHSKHGLVDVYSNPGFIMLKFIYKGIVYHKAFRDSKLFDSGKFYSDNKLSYNAGRFVKEVINQKK